MGDMLVAYEDDVPKDRGLKVSGHCALDSGLGCANTFAPYCMTGIDSSLVTYSRKDDFCCLFHRVLRHLQ